MKTTIKNLSIILPLSFVLGACSTFSRNNKITVPANPSPTQVKDTYPALPPANGMVRINQGQTVTLTDLPLTLTFKQIVNDDRCPLNARCIWAGNATVKVDVTPTRNTTNSNPQTLTLSSGDLRGGLVRKASAAGYDFSLETVYPSPSTSTGFDELQGKYIIDLKVTPSAK